MSYLFRYKVNTNLYEGSVDIRVNTISDLVDDKNERFQKNNNFKSFRELFEPSLKHISTKKRNFKSKNILALKMARMIIAAFCEILMKKLIDDHEVYKLPYRYFALISIRDPNYNYKKNFVFNSYTLGRDYRMVLDLEPGAIKRVHNIGYYITPTDRWKQYLQEKFKKGERYE